MEFFETFTYLDHLLVSSTTLLESFSKIHRYFFHDQNGIAGAKFILWCELHLCI